jgi:hypothetical protein
MSNLLLNAKQELAANLVASIRKSDATNWAALESHFIRCSCLRRLRELFLCAEDGIKQQLTR